MADGKSPTDWSKINQVVQKRRSANELPLNPNRPLDLPPSLSAATAGPVSQSEGAPDAVANPAGVIARYKVGGITRKAAVEMAQVWHSKQLEAMRHRLTEVVRVRNAEATTIADQLLASINAQHLEFLAELGLRNEGQRKKALMELTDQTTEYLREAQERDWPEALREEYINGIFERHRAFFKKLATELGV